MRRPGEGLIIQAAHNMSALQRLLSWLLTLLWWLLWLYLWLPAVAFACYLIWGARCCRFPSARWTRRRI